MLNKLKRLYLNIWDGCNLNCKHCYNEGGKVKEDILTRSEIIRLVEEAKEYLGIEEIQISGGEPTQRPDIFNQNPAAANTIDKLKCFLKSPRRVKSEKYSAILSNDIRESGFVRLLTNGEV